MLNRFYQPQGVPANDINALSGAYWTFRIACSMARSPNPLPFNSGRTYADCRRDLNLLGKQEYCDASINGIVPFYEMQGKRTSAANVEKTGQLGCEKICMNQKTSP